MGINVLRRGFGAVLLGAAAGVLALPSSAAAEEGADPVLADDCGATVSDAQGKPLTVDVGALADTPGTVTVGLGSAADGTNGQEEPLIALPAKDTLDGLGISRAPVVSDAAAGACRVAKPVVNGAGAVVQNVVPGDDVAETPPDEQPTEPEPPEEDVPDETPDNGGAPGGIEPVGVDPDFSGFGSLELFDSGNRPDPLGTITLPPAAAIGPPVQGPDINTPLPETKDKAEQPSDPGAAQAVPTGDEQNRLPLLLAVLALAIVATLLSRALYHRKSS